jgi:membrane protease YdiL (CAAX protease family)
MVTRTAPSAALSSPRRRARPARWRPFPAVVAVVLGLVASQAIGIAVASFVGGNARIALSLVLADLLLLAIVLAVASRGAERLGAATLGIRRTALGPAFGWGAALLFSNFAISALFFLLLGGTGDSGSGHHEHVAHLAAGKAVLVTLGVAVTAPLAEEVAFRGYLFPALTRWRGPWVGAAITALLFGAAHVAALPPAALPAAAAFGFGACLLFWFTGSLLPGVVVHSLNNAIVLTVVTGGQLAPALLAAPLFALLVLLPFARQSSTPTQEEPS